ncbi:ribonuclease III domain-containing protein [Lipomyces tetrasporus]|uniref:Ribonuclease III domain-containing protein n=1 Tax=Lipomyces tetrasporus TaxID=54092 RepID=A0AAD7QSW5_9ASCO|nr:ribonuclease III domain-containing protein [Lipomyces tetrasporus]KAJ8100879.1 ribonuclease III domain-containing protein [Lipomyces tetrasporus]
MEKRTSEDASQEPPAKRTKTALLSRTEAQQVSTKIIKKVDKLLKSVRSLLEVTPEKLDVDDTAFVTDPRVDLAIALKRMDAEKELDWVNVSEFDEIRNDCKTDTKNEAGAWDHRLPSVHSLSTVSQRVEDSHSINASTVSTWPPMLPEIKNPDIAKRIFVHRSLANELSKTSSESAQHYERLEFIGDSFINHVMSRLVYLQFPGAREGELTTLRIHLISNSTLNTWAKLYGFDKRLLVSASAAKSTNVLVDVKSVADTFEAYVAGLLHDSADGAVIAEKWLTELATPTIRNIKGTKMRAALVDKQAKNKLYDMIGTAKRSPEYNVLEGDQTAGYIVSCVLDGEELGRGWATNVKEAGLRAAMDALHSPTIIAKYRRLKIAQFVKDNKSN